jgi:hypothetical protein
MWGAKVMMLSQITSGMQRVLTALFIYHSLLEPTRPEHAETLMATELMSEKKLIRLDEAMFPQIFWQMNP